MNACYFIQVHTLSKTFSYPFSKIRSALQIFWVLRFSLYCTYFHVVLVTMTQWYPEQQLAQNNNNNNNKVIFLYFFFLKLYLEDEVIKVGSNGTELVLNVKWPWPICDKCLLAYVRKMRMLDLGISCCLACYLKPQQNQKQALVWRKKPEESIGLERRK